MQQRLDSIENEFDVVKELLLSAARYAESANQRLDRVAVQQEVNTQATHLLGEKQDRTQQMIDQLGTRIEQTAATQQQIQRVMLQIAESQSQSSAAIEFLTGAVTRLAQNADRTLGAIQEMQSEVKGLQTENRRILEILRERGSSGT